LKDLILIIFLNLFNFIFILFKIHGDWGLGIGDWGLGVGAQTPSPKTPNPHPKTPKL